ncbi:hypothetical protein Q9966_003842, partial [Columba livia]
LNRIVEQKHLEQSVLCFVVDDLPVEWVRNTREKCLESEYLQVMPGPNESERPSQNEKRKEKSVKRGGNRFEPYANPAKRYRAFITNIPFDVKWQSLKDLVKEKVGEVTYVELLMDAEGKSRVLKSFSPATVSYEEKDSRSTPKCTEGYGFRVREYGKGFAV